MSNNTNIRTTDKIHFDQEGNYIGLYDWEHPDKPDADAIRLENEDYEKEIQQKQKTSVPYMVLAVIAGLLTATTSIIGLIMTWWLPAKKKVHGGWAIFLWICFAIFCLSLSIIGFS